MIASFSEILEHERTASRAAGAFTCYELTTALGILHAAETAGVPVILLVSAASFTGRDGAKLLAALLATARQSAASACVQLDHISSLEAIARAIELGVGAVMADGSRLPFDQNVELVQRAVALARPRGVGVEAELGHIEGGEDVAAATHAADLTDPAEANQFAARTGADCLAVSIGNVHGSYAQPPKLDWERLQAIRARSDVHLSLHGASGIPAADVTRAVQAGVVKVNVNAELRRRGFAELTQRLPEYAPGYQMLQLQAALADAASEVASATLKTLDGRR